jgi:hypothetical protein
MKTKSHFSGAIILCGIWILASSLTDKETKTSTNGSIRPVQTVQGVVVKDNFNIVLHKDTINTIRIEADDDMLPYILTAFNTNNVLSISLKQSLYQNIEINAKGITIYVPINHLNLIEVQGASSVNGGKEKFNCSQNLRLEVNGGGAIDVNLAETKKLRTIVSGSGDIDATIDQTLESSILLSGSGDISIKGNIGKNTTTISGAGIVNLKGIANYSKFSISGSGQILAEDLTTNNSTITLSGSNICKTNTTNSLKATIVGGGHVYYKNNPTIKCNNNSKMSKIE